MNYQLLTFNYDGFIAQIPVYSDPVKYPQSILQNYWNIAINYMTNVGNYGSLQGVMRQQALNYLVAHLVFLSGIIASNPTNSEVPGLMQTATIDKVSVGLTPPPLPNQFQWWCNLTPYGQMLLAMLQVNSVGGFYIGGNAPLAAFGYQGGRF